MPRRRRLSRAESQAQTRRRLLAAAERLHAEQGLAQLTVEGVAEEAGYTRGAVYSNFAGRDDLLLTYFETRVERQLKTLAAAVAEGERDALPPREATARLVAALAGDRDYLALLAEFWGYAAARPAVRERFAAIRRRHREALEAIVRTRVQRAGTTLNAPAEHVAAGLLALTTGLLLEGLVDDEFDAQAVHASMAALIYRAADSA